MTYIAIRPPRSVREYRGQKGYEVNGQRLPWMVQDSLGVTLPAGLPDEFVVIGERREQGKAFPSSATSLPAEPPKRPV